MPAPEFKHDLIATMLGYASIRTPWQTTLVGLAGAITAAVTASTPPDVHAQTASHAGYADEQTVERNPADLNNRLARDDSIGDPLIATPRIDHLLAPWYEFKNRLRRERGLKFEFSYTALGQQANRSKSNSKGAAGGVAEFIATWTPKALPSAWEGRLGTRFNNQHRLGTGIPPDQLNSKIGSVWGTATSFDEDGGYPAELWWRQKFGGDRLIMRVGKIDSSSFFDFLTLSDAFTGFISEPLAENAAIAFPDESLGAGGQFMLTEDVYISAGVFDANGGVRSFFDRSEYFRIVEAGWTPTFAGLGEGGISLTLWESDRREKANVPTGRGFAASAEQEIGDFLPFVRYGRSESTATTLKQTAAAGFGILRAFGRKNDVFGLGFTWGETFKRRQRDQYGLEAYYSLQLTNELTMTPDLQVIINPAENPREDRIAIVGLRLRKDL